MTTADDNLIQIARARGLAVGEGEALAQTVAAEFGMAWVSLATRTIPREVVAALPRALAHRHNAMPFSNEGGVLHVAVTDPIAIDVIDDLAYVAGMVIQPALASPTDIREAIARHYGADTGLAEAGVELAVSEPTASDRESPAADRDRPIIGLVHALIAEAIRRRASDIHLEPLERRFRVRYRIDGVLIEVGAPAHSLQLAVISRLKIMAGISIAEKRLPQDGRLQIEVGGRALDLRVSSLPTAHGESIVMRVLDQEGLKLGLPELGFLPDEQQEFGRLMASPDGIVLVTGPTGSGKTTTLYAALHHLNEPGRKIITVEEPVEYQIAGINQVPVNTATGMTFAAALRAMLRQSPNIVMVGEIRDLETAEIAINASLTGHLVLSTLHTNDAPSAVTRLIDLGTKPFLLAAALRAVIAQRLVRRICPDCRRSHVPTPRELQALGLDPSQLAGATLARGTGCAACHGTGYQGRMGIFEILPVDDGLRALIYDNVTASRLRERARRDGMRTLREDGIRKVLAGLTTIEEVVAVTVGDPT